MSAKQIYDENKIIELYKKFGSFNRAALSAGCSPTKLKEIIVKNNIEINIYKPLSFNINSKLKVGRING